MLADVVGGREQSLATRHRAEAADRPIPRLRERPRLPARVAQHDLEAIGLESRTFHREVGEIAVWEKHVLRVPCPVLAREIRGRARSVGRDFEEIEVGGPRLTASGDTRAKYDATPVRAEIEILTAAEGLRRHVRVELAPEVDGRAGLSVRSDCRAEEMRPGAV